MGPGIFWLASTFGIEKIKICLYKVGDPLTHETKKELC